MIDLVFQAMADVEITNKQLESAKKALIEKDNKIIELRQTFVEKDEQIAVLKRGLDKRDAKIKALEEQLTNQTSIAIVDVKRDKKIKELEDRLTIAKNVNEQWKNIHMADSMRITKLEHVLKDLEGTLCGASDHFKELSNSIHKVLE